MALHLSLCIAPALLMLLFHIGSRHILEHVCVKDFSPSLRVIFNRNSSVTISSASLQQWCAQHCGTAAPPESLNQTRTLKLKRPARVAVSSIGDSGSGGSHGNSEGEPVTKLPRVGHVLCLCVCTCSCVCSQAFSLPSFPGLAQLPVACSTNRTASDGKPGESLGMRLLFHSFGNFFSICN